MTHPGAARRRRALGLAALFVAVCLLMGTGASAATRYDPRLRFRTISTPRFDIHFHQGGESLAARLAAFVEAAAAEVDASIGAPAGRVQVILVDQDDLSNGWATPLPYNIIEISAAAPSAGSIIGHTDDWLRLVFVHEYAHIAHLSRARGWIGGLRRVFGRHPALFPNVYQPLWGIEGLATWQESVSTGQGRVGAGDFRLLLDSAAATRRFEPIDRANGGNVDWPSGTIPYLYGAYFHEFLATQFGAASLRQLADETARRLPYFGGGAYRKVFGRSLGALWRDFGEATRRELDEVAIAAVRLTHHGFQVAGPRYAPDGRILYSAASPHHFPALMELDAPGSTPRHVATRFMGNQIAVAGDHVVVDALERVRSVGLQSDLYLIDREGNRRRVTREARASDPDVSRDGRIVCAVQMPDRRALATFPSLTSAAAPALLVSEAFTDLSSPRWSADARLIAAERRQAGGPSEIVLVEPETGALRVLASLPGGRSASPTWMPGDAHVLFAAALPGEAFRLYRADVKSGAVERLEGTGSALSPDVAPDGRTVVFVGYTGEGYDLFMLPLDGARWTAVEARGSGRSDPIGGAVPDVDPAQRSRAADARPYAPVRTLAPRFWTPVLASDGGETTMGVAVASADALGRHAYGVEAAWSARGRPDWLAAYAYDRWRPTLFATIRGDADRWRDGTYHSRNVSTGMLLRSSRVRVAQETLAAFQRTDETCGPCDPGLPERQVRASLRLGWEISTARAFGYSISAEEGGRFSATLELPRRVLGSDGDGVALTASLRGYRRVWPRHGVIAFRAAAAGSWGDPGARQIFSASGHGPEPGGLRFGRGAVGLLRGVAEDDTAGLRAAVLNLDYRLPLLRVGRGVGTVPVFVRALHGALFVDAGHAWSDPARWTDVRLSVGAELSADTVIGFALPVTIAGGAAWRAEGRSGRRDVVAFGRVGRAF